MLVLALQFSKGIAGVGIVVCHKGRNAHRTRRGSGARTLVPGERVGKNPGSLKTEEKTKCVDSRSSGGRILRHSIRVRLTHQCTNWELVRTGPDECRPTMEQ